MRNETAMDSRGGPYEGVGEAEAVCRLAITCMGHRETNFTKLKYPFSTCACRSNVACTLANSSSTCGNGTAGWGRKRGGAWRRGRTEQAVPEMDDVHGGWRGCAGFRKHAWMMRRCVVSRHVRDAVHVSCWLPGGVMYTSQRLYEL